MKIPVGTWVLITELGAPRVGELGVVTSGPNKVGHVVWWDVRFPHIPSYEAAHDVCYRQTEFVVLKGLTKDKLAMLKKVLEC